jgi:signal recognition particle receptor subunit beta
MAKLSREAAEVNARILYWGAQGSGKTANLLAAWSKLRPDHRGKVREVRSPTDPSTTYEVLPIALGEVAGTRTQIELVAVPGAPEQAPARKQMLDQVDGIVWVVDSTPGRVQANLESFEELRQALAAYGRSLSQVPLVVEYNKHDLTDPFALEDLHRKLDLGGAPVFEAVASEGTGVMQALSTISKLVIRALREQNLAGGAAPARPEPPPAAPPPQALPPEEPVLAIEPTPSPAERMERAILAEASHAEESGVESAAREAETLLDRPWEDVAGEIERPAGARLGRELSIVSVGEASRVGERSVRVPLVLGDAEGGTSTLVLTLQLDALVEEEPG